MVEVDTSSHPHSLHGLGGFPSFYAQKDGGECTNTLRPRLFAPVLLRRISPPGAGAVAAAMAAAAAARLARRSCRLRDRRIRASAAASASTLACASAAAAAAALSSAVLLLVVGAAAFLAWELLRTSGCCAATWLLLPFLCCNVHCPTVTPNPACSSTTRTKAVEVPAQLPN